MQRPRQRCSAPPRFAFDARCRRRHAAAAAADISSLAPPRQPSAPFYAPRRLPPDVHADAPAAFRLPIFRQRPIALMPFFFFAAAILLPAASPIAMRAPRATPPATIRRRRISSFFAAALPRDSVAAHAVTGCRPPMPAREPCCRRRRTMSLPVHAASRRPIRHADALTRSGCRCSRWRWRTYSCQRMHFHGDAAACRFLLCSCATL